jgi:hypothetical protein
LPNECNSYSQLRVNFTGLFSRTGRFELIYAVYISFRG